MKHYGLASCVYWTSWHIAPRIRRDHCSCYIQIILDILPFFYFSFFFSTTKHFLFSFPYFLVYSLLLSSMTIFLKKFLMF